LEELKIMRSKAFTMIEVMMALVVVSIMLAVLAPVITVPKDNVKETPSIEVIDSTPVGVIVAWWGPNYPEGWLPVNGQSIADPQYELLRNALGGVDTLPDLNGGTNPNESTTWIIKFSKK